MHDLTCELENYPFVPEPSILLDARKLLQVMDALDWTPEALAAASDVDPIELTGMLASQGPCRIEWRSMVWIALALDVALEDITIHELDVRDGF